MDSGTLLAKKQGVIFILTNIIIRIMKKIFLVLLVLTLGYLPLHAQGRGHAYGRYKHQIQIEQVQPGVHVYTTQRTYTQPRVYYYRQQPSVSFSFPFGYSTYQPYSSYYYHNGYITTQQARALRFRHEHEEQDRRFARERQER